MIYSLNEINSLGGHIYPPGDITIHKIDKYKVDWCIEHSKVKVDGKCRVCEFYKDRRKNWERMQQEDATVNFGRTEVTKKRQVKKAVMKTMDISGKKYRKLQKQQRRNDKLKGIGENLESDITINPEVYARPMPRELEVMRP